MKALAGMGRGGANAGVQRQQELARRTIGAVDDEAPAEPIGLAADFIAVTRNARRVVRFPALGAAGGDAAAALGFDELDAAPIGESLFRRIDDLHDVAMRAAAGELCD